MRKAKGTHEDVLEQKPDVDMPDEPAKETSDEAWSVFPKACVEPLRGLLFLGRLETTVEHAGHQFVLRTLNEGDIVRVGMRCKNAKGTNVELEAQRLYVVASALVSVDGMPVYNKLGQDDDELAGKVEVVKKWYPSIIRRLYADYMELESTASAVVDGLKA